MVTLEWMAGVGRHLLGDQTAAQLHFERVMTLQVELGTLGVDFLGGGQRVGYLCGLAQRFVAARFPPTGTAYGPIGDRCGEQVKITPSRRVFR